MPQPRARTMQRVKGFVNMTTGCVLAHHADNEDLRCDEQIEALPSSSPWYSPRQRYDSAQSRRESEHRAHGSKKTHLVEACLRRAGRLQKEVEVFG